MTNVLLINGKTKELIGKYDTVKTLLEDQPTAKPHHTPVHLKDRPEPYNDVFVLHIPESNEPVVEESEIVTTAPTKKSKKKND